MRSCHRVHNPGQHQPGKRNEQGPKHFFHLLILPKRIDDCVRIGFHTLLYQLGHEDKKRKEHDCSPNECQGNLGLSRTRSRQGPRCSPPGLLPSPLPQTRSNIFSGYSSCSQHQSTWKRQRCQACSVMTDWMIGLNAVTSAIGLASMRTAFLV